MNEKMLLNAFYNKVSVYYELVKWEIVGITMFSDRQCRVSCVELHRNEDGNINRGVTSKVDRADYGLISLDPPPKSLWDTFPKYVGDLSLIKAWLDKNENKLKKMPN